MKLPRKSFHTFVALAAAVLGYATSYGQVRIDGVGFVDRAATGEITLGDIRGGIGLIDYDRDGFPDLVIGDAPGRKNRLFHNVPNALMPGKRTFVDVSNGSGLDDADGQARDAIGVAVADYDNDGDQDVFIVGQGTDGTFGLLYRNDGGGHFTNVSVAAGVRHVGDRAMSAAWGDYDLDGYVDLMVGSGIGTGLAPQLILFHNNHDGTFTQMPGLIPAFGSSSTIYTLLWFDYDRDGWPDCITLATDAANVVLKNIDDGNGGRRFVNVASDIGFVGLGPAPMGISAGDYDGDGDLDLAVSNAVKGTYFKNTGGQFVKFFPFDSIFGWGTNWIDAENDGDLDLFMAGSWGSSSNGGANVNKLFRNLGNGTFDDISAALNDQAWVSRYSLLADFNNDGLQDIFVVNPAAPGLFVSVFENTSTAGNHWLKVVPQGDGTQVNRDAIGAIVRITASGVTRVSEVFSGSSTSSTEDLRQHFGLGANTVVDQIEIIWPRAGSLASRTEVFPGPFAADQIVTLSPKGASNHPGDLNCDGAVDFFDIDPFILAVTDAAAYQQAYPNCNIDNADVNADSSVDFFDIDPFIVLLLG